MVHRLPFAAVLSLTLGASAPLAAQLDFTFRAGASTLRGFARSSEAADRPELRPSANSDVAGSIGYDRGPWRIAGLIRSTSADLVIVGADAGVSSNDQMLGTTFGVEIGRRLVGSAERPSAHLLVGAGYEHWSFRDAIGDDRSKLQFSAALEGNVPFSSAWSGVVRLDGALGKSPFRADDLPEEFERRTARRGSMHLGLRWGR
ncbi:MAG: hypothetical protein U0974_03695 [Gemmatimonadales bacterium]|nr:hypothetical protein [Gemmatimonadales bacterium]MDZ4388817.1 hypothetical protein [Gemmatimonadales bacterium]